MIDTIILQIPINQPAIKNPELFKPPAIDVESGRGFAKYINNSTAEKRNESYRPRLTIIKRDKVYLKVEFSAPKLLLGNNLDEIREKDFDELTNKLRNILEQMGVLLWTQEIENAEVVAFHPSKNIPLSAGYTSLFAISELSKINLNEKMELEKSSFRNGGESLQLYCNRHSFVLYDKINDLNKPPKRAIDKDQAPKQLDMFNVIKEKRKDLEVLRLEVRLSNAKKMKEILRKEGFNDAPLFKNIFKKNVCQKILKSYWEKFFEKNLFLFNVNNRPQKILQMILMKYPKTKIKAAILLTGLNLLCKDEGGFKTFRNVAKNYQPKTNWTRITAYLKKFEDNIFSLSVHGFLKDIRENLDKFDPFKFIE